MLTVLKLKFAPLFVIRTGKLEWKWNAISAHQTGSRIGSTTRTLKHEREQAFKVRS